MAYLRHEIERLMEMGERLGRKMPQLEVFLQFYELLEKLQKEGIE